MNKSEIELEYLRQIFAFKNKKELNSDFLELEERNSFLKTIFNTLDLDEDLWAEKENEFQLNYFIFNQFKRDDALRNKAPKTYRLQCSKYLLKAIGLQPFNKEILEEYLSFMGKDADESFKMRYLNLFHPNSVEYQNAQVDFKIKQDFSDVDYLAEDIIKPLVAWTVDYQERKASKQKNLSQETLETELVKAGLDKNSVEETKKLVPGLLKTAEEALENHWLTYPIAQKAAMAMKSALDLAPYERKTVMLGIEFYGTLYWKIVMNFTEIRSKNGKEDFLENTTGKRKPAIDECINEAAKALDKAKILTFRLKQIPQEEKKDDFFNFDHFRSIIKRKRIHGIEGIEYEDELPCWSEGIIRKETETFQVAKKLLEIKGAELKYGAITLCILFGVLSLGLYLIMGIPAEETITKLLSSGFFLIFLSIMGTLGILGLREHYLKKQNYLE